MNAGFDEIYASRNTPEARQAIAEARAQNDRKRREALVGELRRYEGDLLPGAAARIAERHPELGHGTPEQRAVATYRFMEGAGAYSYKRPELTPAPGPVVRFRTTPDGGMIPEAPTPAAAPAKPRQDMLAATLDRYKADFKSERARQTYYEQNALRLAHEGPDVVIREVVGFVSNRANNASLAKPIPPSERVRHVASLLKPWAHQLKTDEHELAESWPDLVDPLRPAMPDMHIERTILVRLSMPHNAKHLRVEKFDPTDARGERAGVGRPEAQQQQAPAAEPTWAERNAEQFRRRGL